MQVQTEAEERAALAYEAGWLSGRALEITGKLPRVIREAMESVDGLDLTHQSSTEIAALCAAIRAECPALENVNPWENG